MLFNSTVFLFAFLPITVAGFWLIGRGRVDRPARVWLVLASLFFYGWWDPRYLALIVGSIALNYTVGTAMRGHPAWRRPLLVAGVTGDLAVLAYFKYLDFLIGTADTIGGVTWALQHIALPLGISFFTFEQIAYLVDTYRDGGGDRRPLDFTLFVVFFPRLIAGPILRPHEIFPQLEREGTRASATDTAVGLTVFIIGLAKKILIADVMAPPANAVFAAAAHGVPVHLLEAWGGALAYTVRLYFDFSGYSDMAIGLAMLFGLRLPLNFNSPYKATSIIDFWRRWHMTLSRFLRDYLYIPLGGNRRGPVRRYINLLITMLLGGLWHGASWTFVLWGGLHGLYLLIDHAWPRVFNRVTTFVAVVVGWVFFRAPTVAAASTMLAGMIGLHGIAIPDRVVHVLRPILPAWIHAGGLGAFGMIPSALMLGVTLVIAWTAPNTAQLVARWRPVIEDTAPARLAWRPTALAGIAIGLALFFTLHSLFRLPPSEFLYYRF